MKPKEYMLKAVRLSDGKVLSEIKVSSKKEERKAIEEKMNFLFGKDYSLHDEKALEKALNKIRKDHSEVYEQAKTYDEANVYGAPRLKQEWSIERKHHNINDKKITIERYWTIFCEERWRVIIDGETLYENLINEPNINDLNLNEKSMENLTDRDFRNDDVRCPECDSNDFVFLGDGQYRCKSCGEIFDIDDCKTF